MSVKWIIKKRLKVKMYLVAVVMNNFIFYVKCDT
jgi:hypothetical protein